MDLQVAEYRERLIEEARALDARQMRKLLDFLEDLKRGPTEEILLGMLGRTGVSAEEIEDACERLLRSGLVTPRLLKTLRSLAAAKATPEEEQRVDELLQKNRDATITQAEREELRRLVASGERMNLTKAGALVALKFLTGNLPTWVRGKS